MSKTEQEILYKLLHHQTILISSLCFHFGLGYQEVLDIIYKLNTTMDPFAKIEIMDEDHLTLKVHDRKQLNEYKTKALNWNEVYQTERIHRLLFRFLDVEDYLKIDDLADEFYISRRQISKDLAQARKYLDFYQLELVSIPYYGLKMSGKELNKRELLYYLLISKNDEVRIDTELIYNRSLYDQLMNQLRKIFFNKGIDVNDYALINLTVFLYISCIRCEEGCYLDDLSEMHHVADSCGIAKDILQYLREEIQVPIDRNEEIILSAFLSSQYYDPNAEIEEIEEIRQLSEAFLNTVSETYHIRFSRKEELKQNFYKYLVRLFYRLQLGIVETTNTKMEMKRECLYEYQMLLDNEEILENFYHKRIPETDLCYLALLLSIYAHETTEKEYHLILISSMNEALDKWNYMQIDKCLKDVRKEITLMSMGALSYINEEEYDYILTMLPTYLNTSIPVFRFDFKLTEEKKRELRSLFEKESRRIAIRPLLPYTLFFKDTAYLTREEAVADMLDRIRQVKQVDDDYIRALWEFDEEYDCLLSEDIVFLHPKKSEQKESWISIAVNRKQIDWNGKGSIKILCIASLNKEDHLNILLNVVSRLASDEKAVERLLKYGEYRKMINAVVFND